MTTAHAIARVVYRMLTLAPHASAGEYKVEYEKINVEEYEKKYKDQQLKYIKDLLHKSVNLRLYSNSLPRIARIRTDFLKTISEIRG